MARQVVNLEKLAEAQEAADAAMEAATLAAEKVAELAAAVRAQPRQRLCRECRWSRRPGNDYPLVVCDHLHPDFEPGAGFSETAVI